MAFPRRRRLGDVVLIAALTCACALARDATVLTTPADAAVCPGAGTAPTCPYSSVTIVGARAESVLRFPEAVAVDQFGDVYVADQLGYVVQKFNAAGEYLGQWGSYGGGHSQFGPIGGLATDAAGNVYVVDSSHDRIEKFSPSGEFLKDWGRRGSELGEFNFGSSQKPSQPPGGGIAVAGAYVYVADSGNDRIERFNLEGGEPIEWGSEGSGPGQFSYPRGVAANEHEVIVTDDDNHRVEKFSPAGAFEAQAGSEGSGPGQFGFPYGVALDAAGDVYIADDSNHRIVKLGPELNFISAWGGLGVKPGQLDFPRALASDPAGDTYVADTANDRIEVFNPEGAYLRTIGAPANTAAGVFTAPRGLAVDPAGRLFVSDTIGNRVETFAPGSDSYLGAWAATGGYKPGLVEPTGIAVDPRGSVYVDDAGNVRVVRFWGDGTYLSEIGNPSELGGAQLNGAGGLAFSPSTGDLYVADTNHNRVLVYSPTSSLLSSPFGALLAKVGTGGGDGSPGSGAGEFDHPEALAVAPSGDVFVADTANNRIVKLSSSGAFLEAWGSRGDTDGRFHNPTGVAVAPSGHVYVVDSENNRVEVFDEAGRFLGKWGARGDGPGELSQPTAVAVGCEGAVYVADTNNNRVERFLPTSPAGAGCLAPGAWPPPLDVAPVLKVSLPRHTGVLARGGLALSVSCQRGCKILVTATLAPHADARAAGRHRPRQVALLAVARPLPPGLPGHVRLRVTPSAVHELRAELGRRHGIVARVRIVAVGLTGRRTVLSRVFAVTR